MSQQFVNLSLQKNPSGMFRCTFSSKDTQENIKRLDSVELQDWNSLDELTVWRRKLVILCYSSLCYSLL